MIAQLVLNTGSHAGTVATIQPGYYMIGRHAECQIRPKSKSVSRRHCLLHHIDNELRVLDLGSASGTRINEERIPSHQWIVLKHSDTLRLGKVAFDVAIEVAPFNHQRFNGESIQDLDIAGLMEAEDNEDRKRRYEAIREKAAQAPSANLDEMVDLDETSAVEPENSAVSGIGFQPMKEESQVEILCDTHVQNNLPREVIDRVAEVQNVDFSTSESLELDLTSESSQDLSEGNAPAPQPDLQSAPKPVEEQTANPTSKKRSKSKPVEPSTKSTSKRSFSWPSLPSMSDRETLKVIGAFLIAVSVLGLFGYSLYRFQNGPPPKIVEGIQ